MGRGCFFLCLRFKMHTVFFNSSVTEGIGTHIGYRGGGGGVGPTPQVSHDSLDLEA